MSRGKIDQREERLAGEPVRNRWARWVLKMGDDNDPDEVRRAEFEQLRGRVLDNGEVRPGDVVLDVGCGDGWIAFAALDRVDPGGRVVFADDSQDLVDHCRTLAEELGVLPAATSCEPPPTNCRSRRHLSMSLRRGRC